MEKVAALVKERTDGAVEFQLFPQGQLGNQRQMTEGVQLGALEATVCPAAFPGGFNPIVSVMDIPYLLPADTSAAQKLREGEFGKKLLDSFFKKGSIMLFLIIILVIVLLVLGFEMFLVLGLPALAVNHVPNILACGKHCDRVANFNLTQRRFNVFQYIP